MVYECCTWLCLIACSVFYRWFKLRVWWYRWWCRWRYTFIHGFVVRFHPTDDNHFSPTAYVSTILFVHRTAEPTSARQAASPLSVIRHSRATSPRAVVQTSTSTARPHSTSPAPTTRSPQREPSLGPPPLSSQKVARPALKAPTQPSE